MNPIQLLKHCIEQEDEAEQLSAELEDKLPTLPEVEIQLYRWATSYAYLCKLVRENVIEIADSVKELQS